MEHTPSIHVAVLAFPFGTHAAPLLAAIRRLASSSPTAHFSFFSTAPSNNSLFSHHQPNISPRNVWDGVPHGYVFAGTPQEAIALFLNTAADSFREGIKAAVAETGRNVSCLVTDAFFWFAAEIAEEINVPWVPFWTAGAASLTTHVHTDLIRQKYGVGGVAGREQERLSFVPGISKVQIRDLQEGILVGNLDSVFSRMLHKMGAVLPRAAAVFINSFEELDPALTDHLKSTFKKYLNIGPFNLISPPPPNQDPHGCLPWLDRQKVASVAYVSFGSVATPPPHELEALAQALEASGVPFLWSLKDNAKIHLPDGFLNSELNGMIVPWAPQSQALMHRAVGAFITHGGWNSVMESVGGGVPMICRPFFGDQMLNGRVVEDVWEIGVIVEGGRLTKEGVMDGLDQVISQERGKGMREKIRVLKGLAQNAIEPKGSSTRNFIELSRLVLGAPPK